MKEIQEFFSNIKNTFPTITVVDILDILLVTFVIYTIINLFRSTSSNRIARAIILLLALTLITDLLNFHTLNYLLDRVLEMGIIALLIVFQPELRRFLERIGGRSVRGLIGINVNQSDQIKEAVEETVKACEAMSKERVGALIVFERENSLEQISLTGTKVDAAVSQELIRNIFFPKASLHDGAMLINRGRIESAGCVLPLSENRNLSTDLGTRHRAGVGISETNDCVAVIVSEETGTISVAINGMLKRYLSTQTLEKLLMQELIGEAGKTSVIDRIKSFKKGGGKDAEKS